MSEQETRPSPSRKPYQAPVIVELGSLRDVTAGGSGGNFDPTDSSGYAIAS
jgi:hypothetical protein